MRWSAAAAVAVVVFVASPMAVYADPPTPGEAGSARAGRPDVVDINVTATDSGVTIFVGITSTTQGSPGNLGSSEPISGPDGPTCSATAMNIGFQSAEWVRAGLEANPDTAPWTVTCDDDYFGIAWVPFDAPGAPDVVVDSLPDAAVDPVAVAESLLAIVPLPPISVGANPGTGLVAMPSWFWVDGYDGSPLYGSETLGLITVEVEITPERYEWHFGDGTSLETGSLGSPYPAVSDIQHTYEQSSASASEFALRLDITFSARYRVDGGEWQPLGAIVRSFERPYPVQQLQSVLTAGQ